VLFLLPFRYPVPLVFRQEHSTGVRGFRKISSREWSMGLAQLQSLRCRSLQVDLCVHNYITTHWRVVNAHCGQITSVVLTIWSFSGAIWVNYFHNTSYDKTLRIMDGYFYLRIVLMTDKTRQTSAQLFRVIERFTQMLVYDI
jgi:hypothetical protein